MECFHKNVYINFIKLINLNLKKECKYNSIYVSSNGNPSTNSARTECWTEWK